ncbi:MAG: ComEC/Rec2 family competence protein [Candidatus Wolfebacteria bacterium]|nr:ComEC/Rec2 family competence protein [Candidatus Wolfebacteria bacterium]
MLTALLAVLFLFVAAVFSKRKLFWMSCLSLAIIIGSLYAGFCDFIQKENFNVVFGKKINFSGVVINNPERGESRQFTIKLSEPYSGNILVKLPLYPAFNYGDLINFEGVVKSPEPQEYADYLAKNRIFGISNSPEANFVSAGNASYIKTALFRIRNGIVANFQKVLPTEEAALLEGLTVGERAEFSQEFKDAMSKSGTTHMVALSGYNISIIVLAVSSLFAYFLSRRMTFYLTVLVILAFVVMAGAEASVVRAAIMGFLILLASQIGRVYGMRNAMILAAFLMAIVNPRVLKFDAGFQLSFLALLGLVYLSPAIRKLFNFKEDAGVLGWRENFITTTSAQLAVMPLLIINFSKISFVSLAANILILETIPITTFFGFIVGFLGFISYRLSFIFSWLAGIFLVYQIFIIRLFGSFGSVEVGSLSPVFVAVYYILIIAFILYNKIK